MVNVCETEGEYTCSDFLIDSACSDYLALEGQFPSFVYVVQSGEDGPVKIGSARKPSARKDSLQTANWQELHLRAVVPVSSCAYVEKVAHTLADRHNIRGEWFDLEPLQAIEIIISAAVLGGRMPKPLDKLVSELKVASGRVSRKSPSKEDEDRRAKLRHKLGID